MSALGVLWVVAVFGFFVLWSIGTNIAYGSHPDRHGALLGVCGAAYGLYLVLLVAGSLVWLLVRAV